MIPVEKWQRSWRGQNTQIERKKQRKKREKREENNQERTRKNRILSPIKTITCQNLFSPLKLKNQKENQEKKKMKPNPNHAASQPRRKTKMESRLDQPRNGEYIHRLKSRCLGQSKTRTKMSGTTIKNPSRDAWATRANQETFLSRKLSRQGERDSNHDAWNDNQKLQPRYLGHAPESRTLEQGPNHAAMNNRQKLEPRRLGHTPESRKTRTTIISCTQNPERRRLDQRATAML